MTHQISLQEFSDTQNDDLGEEEKMYKFLSQRKTYKHKDTLLTPVLQQYLSRHSELQLGQEFDLEDIPSKEFSIFSHIIKKMNPFQYPKKVLFPTKPTINAIGFEVVITIAHILYNFGALSFWIFFFNVVVFQRESCMGNISFATFKRSLGFNCHIDYDYILAIFVFV